MVLRVFGGDLLACGRVAGAPAKNRARDGVIRTPATGGPIVSVFKQPWPRVVLAVVLAEGALVFGGLSFVPAYLQQTLGMSSAEAGLLTALFGAGALLYVINARQLVGRFGEVRLTFAGGWVLALCYLCYLTGFHWLFAALAGVLSGLGYYLLHAVLQTNATQMAPEVRGTAVSLFACFLFLGQALGVAFGGLVVDGFGIVWVLIGAGVLLAAAGHGVQLRLNCQTARSVVFEQSSRSRRKIRQNPIGACPFKSKQRFHHDFVVV